MEEKFDLTEIEKSAHTLYDGKIISLRVDDVILPDGQDAKREYVHHRGGASILAVDGEDNVYLVRQFRYPYRETVLEIPAGKLEEGEDAITTAERELKEEIGMIASEIVPFGLLYPSPGYTDERLYVFLARGLIEGSMSLDDGEFLRVEKLPFAEVLSDVMSGKIRDAKTCFAILKYANLAKKF